MIYVDVENENRTVQAMQVPGLFDIPSRQNIEFWLASIIGRREFIWKGDGVRFAATSWKAGDWIIAEVADRTGDIVFTRMTSNDFDTAFGKVL